MTLYDDLIREWLELFGRYEARSLSTALSSWKDAGNDNMVFLSDTAVELGGERRFSMNALAVTEDPSLVPEDRILLIGPDIGRIDKASPFARLTLVRTKAGLGRTEGGEDASSLYGAIRSLELIKYHVNPEGYMLRISPGRQTEAVRISREAVERGMSFSHIGNMYREAFHKNKLTEAVMSVFITDPAVDFDRLKKLMKLSADITKTLDHISEKAALMDCGTCDLQEVCDEVEGLRELHFKK